MSAKLKLRADTLSCFFYFLMVGVYYALFTSRLPAIKAETGIGDAEVGISLLTLGIASVTGLIFCGRLIERFTSRRLLQVSSLALCLIVPFAGLAPNAVTLYLVTACLGLAVAIWDVCMNAQALLLEIETHGRYMGKMQAGYSFGCILGALVGALFAYFALSPFVTFLAFSLTTLFFWCFAFRHLKDDLPRQKTEKRGRMPLFIYFCGLLEILAFTGEGSIGDWGSIFLHSAKGATEATAALSFGVCALAMTLVRTQSDTLRENNRGSEADRGRRAARRRRVPPLYLCLEPLGVPRRFRDDRGRHRPRGPGHHEPRGNVPRSGSWRRLRDGLNAWLRNASLYPAASRFRRGACGSRYRVLHPLHDGAPPLRGKLRAETPELIH